MPADTEELESEPPKVPEASALNDTVDKNGQHHPIAEFLYQLTKMLTDDNSEIIEWSDSRIKVHFPERLESEVLHKYFRHSKFASFQRQLNYFGFRKIAGKGKMSPCSYVNEAATSDIRSLLLIKRKTNGSAARKAAIQRSGGASNAHQLGSRPDAMAFPGFLPGAAQPGQVAAVMNGQLASAMALLTQNAVRAGLGQMQMPQVAQVPSGMTASQLTLLSMQQQLAQQQQQLSNQTLPPIAPNQPHVGGNVHLTMNSNMQQSAHGPAPVSSAPSNSAAQMPHSGQTPSLEQLQAQLAASLVGKQNLLPGAAPTNQLGARPSNVQATNPATAALNPASAALQALNAQIPPSAEAPSSQSQQSGNPFESAINLKTLLNEHNVNQDASARPGATTITPGAPQVVHSVASNALMHRLPSSNTIFPDMTTATSFGNLLGSSNRLSSLLSLNSFLGSREHSLADFAAANTMSSQLATGTNPSAATTINGLHQLSSSDNNGARKTNV